MSGKHFGAFKHCAVPVLQSVLISRPHIYSYMCYVIEIKLLNNIYLFRSRDHPI